MVIALIAAEVIFMILRYILEQPYLKRQKFYIFAEAIAMIAAYLIMYLWNDSGVISVYCSIILFLFILLFIEDLLDVYNDTRDQFYEDDFGFLPGATHKVVNNKNRNDWKNHKRSVKKNENPWTNNRMDSITAKDLLRNEHLPPSTERQRLKEDKEM